MKTISPESLQPQQRVGDFDTIAQALDYAAGGATGLRIYDNKGEYFQNISYAQLRIRAIETAGKLLSLGLKRGDTVAIIADTCADFFALFYGCQYAGLLACPLPYAIYMGGKAAYLKRIASLSAAANAKILCCPDSLEELKSEFVRPCQMPVHSFSQIRDLQPDGCIDPLRADEGAYIQFSSGSTSEPKGVMISQRAISSNARGILRECIRIEPSDRAFSWLPLYHDMGLVGFSIAPLYAQTNVDYITPATFARRPLLWLQLMSRNRSTITYAPVFGYRLAATRLKPEEQELDLSSLKLAGIGGDMILAEHLHQFAHATRRAGFNPDSFTPSYGMAESTLLVSYRHGLKTDRVDKKMLETENKAVPCSDPETPALTFAVCGRALNRHELYVGDSDGNVLPPRHAGHIYLRGPSLMSGYCNNASAAFPVDNSRRYMDTGDMGYMVDGEIVLTGRYKDMIAINGRNIWPQDIEQSVSALPCLSSPRVAAFSIDEQNGESIVILVESTISDPAEREKLISLIKSVIHSSEGIAIRVRLIKPRSLEYTSSGKLSREKARQLYLAGLMHSTS